MTYWYVGEVGEVENGQERAVIVGEGGSGLLINYTLTTPSKRMGDKSLRRRTLKRQSKKQQACSRWASSIGTLQALALG